MKLLRAAVMGAAILVAATAASAQKPDFSGTWTLDPASAPADGDGYASVPMVITQTADALTVERTAGEAKVTMIFKLDGSDSRNVVAGLDGQQIDVMSTAKWDGLRLTIVSKREIGGRIAESSQIWSVEGSTLTVESTSPRGTRKRIYRK